MVGNSINCQLHRHRFTNLIIFSSSRTFGYVQLIKRYVYDFRLDSAGEEYILCENKVIELRKTNAKLEKQVERLRVSNKSQTGSVKNRPTSRSGKKNTKEKSAEEMLEELEELRARYGMQGLCFAI